MDASIDCNAGLITYCDACFSLKQAVSRLSQMLLLEPRSMGKHNIEIMNITDGQNFTLYEDSGETFNYRVSLAIPLGKCKKVLGNTVKKVLPFANLDIK